MKFDLRRFVGICTSCDHWQIDIRGAAIRDFGGTRGVLVVMAEANSEHVWSDCAGGTTGRIKVMGQWVDRPQMESGKPADGVLAFAELPRWWVSA